MRKRYERKKHFVIGKERADVAIASFPAYVWVDGNQITVETETDGQLYRNGQPAENSLCMTDGDELEWQNGRIVFLGDSILLDIRDEAAESSLLELELRDIPFEGYPKYKRSPRLIKRAADKEIALSKPKEEKEGKQESLIQLVVPPVIMLGIT
ncbi:MAG: hypothetical protein K2O73_00440, partial [Lachnospiraceae bacterium]|nr:hypothetical protein [Lachnospiraceae bacterium]